MTFLRACVILVFVLGVGAANAQILKYDSKGRPISQEKYKGDSKGSVKGVRNKNGSGYRSGGSANSRVDKLFTHEPGEVLVVNPGSNFVSKAITMGYRVKETIGAKELGMKVLRLTIPKSQTPEQAVKALAKAFPGTTFDVNAHYHVQGAPDNARTARKLAGWNRTTKSCGRGIRIGVIDSGLDPHHPAFEGQAVSYLSFPKPGRKAGGKAHGTAVSSILTARAEWGGLLPGARLYHANMFEINEKGKMVGTAAAFVKAMAWLVGAEVHALNISMAGKENKVIRRALDRAKEIDLLVVASIGGWGKSDRLAYPA